MVGRLIPSTRSPKSINGVFSLRFLDGETGYELSTTTASLEPLVADAAADFISLPVFSNCIALLFRFVISPPLSGQGTASGII